MCQHALCEHGKRVNTLMPEAPSTVKTITGIACALLPFLIIVWLFTFGRIYIPFEYSFTLFVIFFTTLVLRSLTFPTSQLDDATKAILSADTDHLDWLKRSKEDKFKMVYAEKLGEAIRVQTVSVDQQDQTPENQVDQRIFLKLHAVLEKNFPLVHSKLERKVINQYSLLFHWPGSNSSLKPYLLAGHMDVVPVLDGHLWAEGPFSGTIKDGFIHGRGAIDDKQAVCGILSAVEDLLQQGFQPQRDIYIAFGHDEETGGNAGAAKISEYLVEKKLHFEFMLDEGLFVMDGILPGLKHQVALVCIAEKGYLVNELRSSVDTHLAGHASTPSSESAIGVLARGLTRLESHPMPSYLIRGSPVRLMFESLAPHFSGPFRILFTNLWIFAPVLKKILERKNTTATMIRTTTALTVIHGGSKENVLPREASAWINHRIHPIDSVDGVIAYTNSVLRDSRIGVKEVRSTPPAPVSSHTSVGFHTIRSALGRALPDVLVAPALMVGNTDTHHYWPIVTDIYRFSPTRLNNTSISMFHGANEKMKVDNFIETIGFYRAIITLADKQK